MEPLEMHYKQSKEVHLLDNLKRVCQKQGQGHLPNQIGEGLGKQPLRLQRLPLHHQNTIWKRIPSKAQSTRRSKPRKVTKFRRSDDFQRIPVGTKLGKSIPADMTYTTGSPIPSELRTQQQQKATAPTALFRPIVKTLKFELNKTVKVTRLRYKIGATGP